MTETLPPASPTLERALSFTTLTTLRAFVDAAAAQPSAQCHTAPGECAYPELPGRDRVVQLRLGNEFCQRLLPSPAMVREARQLAARAGLAFGLVLPNLTDAGIARADRLLGELPDGTEVTVNDWGLMRRIDQRFARLSVSAGRLLCKLLKEPRVMPADAATEPQGWANPGFASLVQRLHAKRVELDIPPFPGRLELAVPGMRICAHAPFGFATTGRICRIGNLRQPPARKFAAEHGCARECLLYSTRITRRSVSAESLNIYQRGNTIFYRHGAAARAALAAAIAAGTIDRLVIPGDWHENRRADPLA